MKRDKILIITNKEDSHSDYIIEKYGKSISPLSFIRINTEDFVNNNQLTFDGYSFSIMVLDSQRKFDNDEILSVWYRRPKKFNISVKDSGINSFIEQQTTVFLNGLYYSCADSALWVNPLDSRLKGKNKLRQLQLANALGFNVPETIVSNTSSEILLFIKKHKKICHKSLDQPFFYREEKLHSYMTRIVSSENEITEYAENIKMCPTLFQKYIEKQFDVRVTVFDNKIFAFKIHSQEHELARIDCRGKAAEYLKHESISLPREIEEKIFQFMNRENLIYSAFDFVISQSNDFYFIENNANGQWLWLELVTGINLSTELVKLLTTGKNTN